MKFNPHLIYDFFSDLLKTSFLFQAEEVWHRVLQIIINRPDVQFHSVRQSQITWLGLCAVRFVLGLNI